MKEVLDTTLHVPVLFDEVIKALSLAPGKIAVDATLGGGGHAQAILQEVLASGKVIAIDTDEQAIARFENRIRGDVVLQQAIAEKKLVLVKSNYSNITEVLQEQNVSGVDAILADLGFSSDQIESKERGMSFQKNGELDMRLDQTQGVSAREILSSYSLEALEKIFREYGEEKEAHRIAKAVVEERDKKAIVTTEELRMLIENVYPKRLRYAQKIHPATKIFQALRIEVNQEFEHLKRFLSRAVAALKPGGRLAVITFHSGEDRIVKQFFKKEAEGCVCPPEFPVCRCDQEARIKILTKKAIQPSEEEIGKNPRARSAKLRVIEKI